MPSKEFGDWQTPDAFALKACKWLNAYTSISPSIILEPTCGLGSFVEAASEVYQDCPTIIGAELNEEYVEASRTRFSEKPNIEIVQADFFVNPVIPRVEDGELLIVGNPPWVTNSELSAMGSQNLPDKSNIRGLKGMDAITGSSNFDICEYIILRLMEEYQATDTVIAMLCKTGVARNLVAGAFSDCMKAKFHIAEFDAHRVFDINASACLFVCDFRGANSITCMASSLDDEEAPTRTLEYKKGKLSYALSETAKLLDGDCQLTWRQGVKHDCSKIMELKRAGKHFENGVGEEIDIETDLVYPLLKSSELKKPLTTETKREVLITQKTIGEDTSYIQSVYPKTWEYLSSNGEKLDGRKSSIYRGKPRFSIFGIGDYSFSRYKVAISGFYKEPRFSLIDGSSKAVMLDDTCYFIGLDSFELAYPLMLLLNSKVINGFLKEVSFSDAKRPYTKKVLQRIDLYQAINLVGYEGLLETERSLDLAEMLTPEMVEEFLELVTPNEARLF